MKNLKIISILTIFFALSFNMFGKTAHTDNTIKFNIPDDPITLDVTTMSDVGSVSVSRFIYAGLVNTTKDGQIVPELAESWDIKGKKIIFHLKKGVLWSDGKTEVTAKDFLFAIKLGLEPKNASPYSYYLDFIVNAEDYRKGKISDFSTVGIKALDNHTLQIETNLEKDDPISELGAKVFSFVSFFPINEKFYKSANGNLTSKKEKILCNGPWILKEWNRGSNLKLIKNRYYWNSSKIRIQEIDMLIVRDEKTVDMMYKKGDINLMMKVPGNYQPYYKTAKELKEYDQLGLVYYLLLNLKDPILKEEKIRRALSYAIDREKLCEKVLKDGSKPAYGFVPYGMKGKKGDFRKEYGVKVFDPKLSKAKKLLAKGMKKLNIKKLELKLLCNSNELHQKIAQFIQEELYRKLDVKVDIESVSPIIRIGKCRKGDFQISMFGVQAIHIYPDTFLEFYTINNVNNMANWFNKEYDKLVVGARNMVKSIDKFNALAEAERIICKETPIIPLYFAVEYFAAKPWVKGVEVYIAGYYPSLFNAYIDDNLR